MNNSWWRLGDSGITGRNLAIRSITCAFCMEEGNFETVHHEEKKHSRSDKTLNFDTLKCGNCAGYVMVFWSASEYGNIHDYQVLPYPIRTDRYPDHWPDEIGRFWVQAKRSAQGGNWDAAALTARSALQAALRCHPEYSGNANRSLKQEIDDLASKGHLPPTMKAWSDELRALGNISAHPNPGGTPIEPQAVYDIIEFLDFLLEYLYNLPHQIQQYQNRGEV